LWLAEQFAAHESWFWAMASFRCAAELVAIGGKAEVVEATRRSAETRPPIPTSATRLSLTAHLSNNVIDTSRVATDTIDYVATDDTGNAATSTRTVLIEAATAATSSLP
jgi:hypothetical protein